MIRALLLFIFFLLIFTACVFFAMQQPGFVTFSYGDTERTISLVHFVIGLFILLPLLYVFFKILGLIFNAPKRIHNSVNSRRKNKAINNMQKGLTKYTQGDWSQAEKLLVNSASHSNSANVNYLWAANAAHKRGDFAERDVYLSEAKNSSPDDSLSVDVLRAEFLLDQQLPEQALACLSSHRDSVSSNPKVAGLFAGAYQQQGDWSKLAETIPQLKNSKNINLQSVKNIERQALKGLLNDPNNTVSLDDIATKFKDSISSDPELTLNYVSALRKQGKHELAAITATTALDKTWCSKLVREYGLIDLNDPNQALAKAENWVKQHTNDENLYLTLGRICTKAQLWGKAKSYFETSLTRKPLAETYAELSSLHEQLDEMDEAQRCAKKGLKLATRNI